MLNVLSMRCAGSVRIIFWFQPAGYILQQFNLFHGGRRKLICVMKPDLIRLIYSCVSIALLSENSDISGRA